MEDTNNNTQPIGNEGQQQQQQNQVAPEPKKDETNIYIETLNRWMEKLTKQQEDDQKPQPSVSEILSKEEREAKEKQELEELRSYKQEIENLKAVSETQKILQDRGLPIFIADKIIGETTEDTSKNIKAFQKMWDKEIEAAVNKRLSESGFKVKQSSSDESLQKLSSQELINKLSKGEIDFGQYWKLMNDSKQ